jgi:hypothetical protein
MILEGKKKKRNQTSGNAQRGEGRVRFGFISFGDYLVISHPQWAAAHRKTTPMILWRRRCQIGGMGMERTKGKVSPAVPAGAKLAFLKENRHNALPCVCLSKSSRDMTKPAGK